MTQPFHVSPTKIAILRALQLGDLLNMIPAVRALRLAYPDAEITLLGLPWAASFVRRFSRYFDRFIHFPGYPGLPEQGYDEAAFELFLEEMRAEQFDLLLQMQGNGRIVNTMIRQFGALRIAGFQTKESHMYEQVFMEYPEGLHEIDRHLALMEHLGIHTDNKELEFPLTEQDYLDFALLRPDFRPGKYVCIHPGSRGGWRQWPPRHFALLADYCAEKGLNLVITGTAEEKDITRELIKWIKHPVRDLTGLTSMGAMGVLLKGASLLISNCTGVSHMAAALQTPSVIISMDGEPERWAPKNHRLHRTIDWTKRPPLREVLEQTGDLIESLSIKC